MTGKTVHEMQAEHGRASTEILSRYHEVLDALREEREPEAGAYLDRLTPEQRMGLMREQKTQKAGDARREALEAYTAAVEDYHEGLQSRQGRLKALLFGVDGPDGAAALSRTVTASDGELSAYLDVAELSGNEDLARAVFVAAERRNSGASWPATSTTWIPKRASSTRSGRPSPAEVLERQRESVEQIVAEPDPGRLMPPPRVEAY